MALSYVSIPDQGDRHREVALRYVQAVIEGRKVQVFFRHLDRTGLAPWFPTPQPTWAGNCEYRVSIDGYTIQSH